MVTVELDQRRPLRSVVVLERGSAVPVNIFEPERRSGKVVYPAGTLVL